jgi:hypothetical protein
MTRNFDPERLRPADFACEPDPRTIMSLRPLALAEHHADISAVALHAGVPQDVALQFETARNLYLYAWFIYRFYPVAEQHSLACLELSLRDRLKEDIRQGKVKAPGTRPMLRILLKYAVEQGLVKNERFERWRNRGAINARQRVEMERIREMMDKNLAEISLDDSEVQVTAEDLNWNYANVLIDTLPKIRNTYAHGSTTLHNMALGTIQVVCEIINQLYEEP